MSLQLQLVNQSINRSVLVAELLQG